MLSSRVSTEKEKFREVYSLEVDGIRYRSGAIGPYLPIGALIQSL